MGKSADNATDRPRESWMVRARFWFLALYLIGIVGLLFFLVWSDAVGLDVWPHLVLSLFFFVPPVLLLIGAPHWHWPRPRRRRAMWVSIIGGSAMAAALSCGILLTLLSFLENIRGKENDTIRNAFNSPAVCVAFISLPWLFWLVIFGVIWVGQWLDLFKRMYRVLLAGTWLELAITIPVDVQVRKRTQCYCGEGTFWALVVGVTAIFWTFGPGVVFLFLARRMQRRQETGRCVKCNYDLRGSPGPRCPECGTVFEKEPLAPQAGG